MKRSQEFKESVEKPVYVNDTRFGLRKMFLNPTGKAKKGVYMNAGRGANGEHNG